MRGHHRSQRPHPSRRLEHATLAKDQAAPAQDRLLLDRRADREHRRPDANGAPRPRPSDPQRRQKTEDTVQQPTPSRALEPNHGRRRIPPETLAGPAALDQLERHTAASSRPAGDAGEALLELRRGQRCLRRTGDPPPSREVELDHA